jgi:hypothetical protein
MNKMITIVLAISLTACANMTPQQKSVAAIIAGALILGAANKGQSNQCKAPPGGYCVVPSGK